MTFTEQYKHPEWQKKRLEVLEFRAYTCQQCGASDQQLHVHHPIYKKGAKVWEYDASELICLCHDCHKLNHAVDKLLKESLARLDMEQKVAVLGYAEAFLGGKPRTETSQRYIHGFLDNIRCCDDALLLLLKK